MQCQHKSLLIFLTGALTWDSIDHLCFQLSNTIFCKAKYPIPGGTLGYHIANSTAPVPASENSTLLIDGDDTAEYLVRCQSGK